MDVVHNVNRNSVMIKVKPTRVVIIGPEMMIIARIALVWILAKSRVSLRIAQ